jgi:precorrin-2 methylase
MKKGKLIFVGLGIKSISHITVESRSWIRQSDLVIYHVVDRLTENWIKKQNKNNFSLSDLYVLNQPRLKTYKNMVAKILKPVDEGKTVCVALYGNPGFYVYATHHAAKIAKRNGHYVEVNPGISTLDCLFSDLDIDIVNEGLQVVEATSILSRYKEIDTTSYVIIMQPGPVGEPSYKNGVINTEYLQKLTSLLTEEYGPNHPIYIYHAAIYPITSPLIKKIRIVNLSKNIDIYLSTLCIPPKKINL